MERFFDWLPLVSIAALMAAAKVRAGVLQRRGQRVIVVDWDRPAREVLYDVLVIAAFLFWFYLLLAAAWPFSMGWLPDWLSAKLFDNWLAKIVGAVLVLIAPALFTGAVRSMGGSWRIGIDRESPPPLVTTGLFAWLRNPIYVAFDLIIIGAFLIHGRVVVLLTGAALVLLVHGVIRREERFLAEQFGEAFRSYRARVGRYSPWI